MANEGDLRKKFDDVAGRVCKALIPVRDECYFGRGQEIAVCTLGSMRLLREISTSPIMDRLTIAGRLLSENKGIDLLLDSIARYPRLNLLVVCGKDVRG